MVIHSEPYSLILDRYQASLNWLESLGLDISKGRLSSYSDIIGYISNNYQTADSNTLKEKYPDAVNSFYESMAIMDVYQKFGNYSAENLGEVVNKLSKAIYGPEHNLKETHSSSEARNYLFEAITSAKLHVPEKGAFGMFRSASDTGTTFEGKRLLVECKRLNSHKKIEKNVRVAANQLKTQLNDHVGSGYRGLIALDISKLVNPEFHLFSKENDVELVNGLTSAVQEFIDKYENIWHPIIYKKSKKILGVLIRMSVMGQSKQRNLLATCSEWGLNPCPTIKSSDGEFLVNLTNVINQK